MTSGTYHDPERPVGLIAPENTLIDMALTVLLHVARAADANDGVMHPAHAEMKALAKAIVAATTSSTPLLPVVSTTTTGPNLLVGPWGGGEA